MQTLRSHNISCVCNFNNTKIKNQFKLVDFYNAKYASIIDEDEMKNKTVQLKNQKTLKQETVEIKKILEAIK